MRACQGTAMSLQCRRYRFAGRLEEKLNVHLVKSTRDKMTETNSLGLKQTVLDKEIAACLDVQLSRLSDSQEDKLMQRHRLLRCSKWSLQMPEVPWPGGREGTAAGNPAGEGACMS